jgi:hypothetical protein
MKIYLVMLFVIFTGCTKEQITSYSAYLSNNTTHNIVIRPYFKGIVPNNKIVSIAANDSFQIANGTDRGIVNNAGFNSDYLSGSDSITVTFDNLYKITHYFTQPDFLAPKYYLVTSNRNIYNKDNYSYTYKDPTKNRRESSYLYKFVEQDFLDTH